MKEIKRILYVSSKIPMSDHHLSALRMLNFHVDVYNYQFPSFTGRAIGVLYNKKILKDKSLIIKEINRGLLGAIQKYKPDCVLVIKGLEFDPKIIRKMSNAGVVMINWFPDFWEFMPWYEKNVWAYDYFFNSDELVVAHLRKKHKQVHYVPFGINPDPVVWDREKKYDIVFSGQWTLRRERIFNSIADLGLKIWGYSTWEKSTLAKNYQGYLKNFTDVFDIFRQSKIIVNTVTGEEKVPVKAVNLRVFEATGVGAMVLNWHKSPIDTFFKGGKEIVNYTSITDLRQKALYYLKHTREREVIAKKGWERTVRSHTYWHRFIEIFRIINETQHNNK